MELFALKKAVNPEMGDGDIARLAKIDPQAPGRWAKKYGSYYLSWLEEFLEQYVEDDHAKLLDMVGMTRARQGNFQFWDRMAKKHGVIADEPKEMKVTLNTNFEVILQGGDLADARRRILQEVRGLGDARAIEVVSAPARELGGGVEGSGGGAGDLPTGPLALPAPLGRDGGRSEREGAVSAVSKRPSLAGSDPRLGKRAVPPGAKK